MKGFTRAGLPLKNAGQMIFILPDEGISPYDLITSPEQMKEVFEGGESYNGEVVWKIPKFGFSSKLSMTDKMWQWLIHPDNIINRNLQVSLFICN